MECVDGDKDDIPILILQFYDFMDPSLVVPHPDQSAENTHAVVDMDDIIADIESRQVIQGQLFRFFDGPSHRNAVETVEDFMVRIAADFFIPVDETGMDVFFRNELRQNRSILGKNAFQTIQLGRFLSINEYLIPFFQFGPDIGGKQFEVLVEYRLRRNMETDGFHILCTDRRLQIYPTENGNTSIKFLFLIHIRRIQPNQGILRKNLAKRSTRFRFRNDIRIDFYAIPRFLGQLGIGIEQMDFLNFVAKEGNTERIFIRIRKNIYDGAADGVLSRSRYEINPFKSAAGEDFFDFIVTDFITYFYFQDGFPDFPRFHHPFFQGFRIRNNHQ